MPNLPASARRRSPTAALCQPNTGCCVLLGALLAAAAYCWCARPVFACAACSAFCCSAISCWPSAPAWCCRKFLALQAKDRSAGICISSGALVDAYDVRDQGDNAQTAAEEQVRRDDACCRKVASMAGARNMHASMPHLPWRRVHSSGSHTRKLFRVTRCTLDSWADIVRRHATCMQEHDAL